MPNDLTVQAGRYLISFFVVTKYEHFKFKPKRKLSDLETITNLSSTSSNRIKRNKWIHPNESGLAKAKVSF